jgi:ribonuclease P protein component
MMAPALPRLKKRSEFLRVAATGRKSVAPGLILQERVRVRRGEDCGEDAPIRVGFTVSKKVGGAVERNRAKRRLRAVAEEVLSRHARGGRDYVLIGRGATLRRPFVALRGDLERALRRLDAYRNGAPDAGDRNDQGGEVA